MTAVTSSMIPLRPSVMTSAKRACTAPSSTSLARLGG
uniref:Uncharacterized protein n=1 Tax=Arundo donax TaxID=35708 RepID=A0A0A9SZU9_ARUDO